MTKENSSFSQAHDLDYKLMDRIITNMDLDNMNMMDVARRIFEGTAMYYSLQYYEAKKEEMYMYDKVLEKNKKIDALEVEVFELKEKYEPEEAALRAKLPEDSEGPPKEAA